MIDIYRVTQKIEVHKLVNLTRRLIQIPSVNPPGNEGEVAELLADEMGNFGLEVNLHRIEEKRFNVTGRLCGEESKPTLLFLGHTDVVPVADPRQWSFDPFLATIYKKKIYGRGAADMKGGLAAMTIATGLMASERVKFKGNLVVAGVIDEEGRGKGVKNLMNILKPDMVIIGEPTDLRVCTTHKGALALEVVTRGKAVHSSIPEKGINAIEKMAKVITNLEKLRFLHTKHPLLGCPTVNPGVISGGTKRNIVPHYCKAEIDVRFLPGQTVERILEDFTLLIERLRRYDTDLNAELVKKSVAQPVEVSCNEPVAMALLRSCHRILGEKPAVVGLPYASDASFLVNKAGVPTVLFGPGKIEVAHAINEFVMVDDLVRACKIYVMTAWELLRDHSVDAETSTT